MLWWEGLILISLSCIPRSSVSILWPAGTYGIPKPASGCPWSNGFQWETGWRFQDTDGRSSNNDRSSDFHLDGRVDEKGVKRSFCIKTDTTSDTNRPRWPPGKYCIYKKGSVCPGGLMSGFVYWDDDDNRNLNGKGGTLPEGIYDKNTRIEFCCRADGDKNDPILLPAETPFFMLVFQSTKCQMVKWAIASLEWIYFDTEHSRNADNRGGKYPHDAATMHPTIYYCYYRGCNETFTGLNGTFHSPNYPRNYSDGQYCSWRIAVRQSQRIHLTFTNFSLESENNTDSLSVYDGENSTGEMLGVFYGGHPPPKEGIYSSSNQMLVIFKSDWSISLIGFRASYKALNYSVSTAATRTSSAPEVTPSSAFNPETLHTEKTKRTTVLSHTGNRKQRHQSQGKGLDVISVVAPVVVLLFFVALIAIGFIYWKRRRRSKEEQGKSGDVLYNRSNDETLMSLENPCYDRRMKPYKMVKEESGSSSAIASLITENTACSADENELYFEVEKEENMKNGESYMKQENENPLYETTEDETVPNPIYDSGSIIENSTWSGEESELYTEVEDEKEDNMKTRQCYLEQENENPLYETTGGDAALNPIYDSST